MYKKGQKYKLIGYQTIGVNYNIDRVEIAEFKNGEWYPFGKNKTIGNMVIKEIIELNE